MSDQSDISSELNNLLESKEDILAAFASPAANIREICQRLEEHQLIDQKAARGFRSLDSGIQDSGIQVRFLWQQVYKSILNNRSLAYNFKLALRAIGMNGICQNLGEKITNTSQGLGDGVLSEDDLSILMEILGDKCFKWNFIGLMLKLPAAILEAIDAEYRWPRMKLYHALSKWLTGQYSPVTLTQLKKALESKTVGEVKLAEDLSYQYDRAHCSSPALRMRPDLPPNAAFQILQVSCSTEVLDGKSALLEVRTTVNETASFQWKKEDTPLQDGELFLGTTSSMLLVMRVCRATQGEYSCHINGEQKSRDISLSVKYSTEEKEHLISKYSLINEVSNDSWPLPTTSKFINLALIKMDRQQRHPSKYFMKGPIDAILKIRAKKKEKVTYEEVFGEYKEGAFILVEGRPGSGKTTLACKITRDWAVDSSILRYASYVFLLPLRGYKENRNLIDLFRSVLKLAGRNGKGFCFILDGLDEWRKQEGHQTDKDIMSIISRDSLPQAMVIVMSRPAEANEYREKATKRVEVIGFSKTQVYEYIDMYPFKQICDSEDESKAMPTELKEYLGMHKNALHICYLPVHAAMMCFLYSLKVDVMPETETQIYDYFTRSIILRKLQQKDSSVKLRSLDDMDEHCKMHFSKVCKLAFSMLCEKKQVVQESQDFSTSSQEPPNSLLTIDSMAQIYGLDNVMTFLHLTLQEYLAARHITGLSLEEQMEVIQQHGTCDRMPNMWKFYCGINSDHNSKAVVFEALMKTVKMNHMYKVECAYESQRPELCTKMVEVESGSLIFHSLSLTPVNSTALGYVLAQSTLHPSALDMRVCTSDSIDQDDVEIDKRLESISRVASSPALDLGNFISSIRSNIPDLINQYLAMKEEDGKALVDKIKGWYSFLTSKNVSMFGIDVGTVDDLLTSLLIDTNKLFVSESSKPVIEALHLCAPHLCELNVSQNVFGPEGTAVVSEALKHCSSLKKLDISANLIGSKGASSLASGLKYCIKLEELGIFVNKIDKEGERVIAAATVNLPKLANINVSWNMIGEIAFADHQHVKILNISGTGIGPVFSRETPPQFPPSLQKLNLSYNQIDSDGAMVLAEALTGCTQLRKLNLSSNTIGFESALMVIECVKTSIRYVDLSNNDNIGEDYVHLCNIYEEVEINYSNCSSASEARLHESDAVSQFKDLAKDLLSYSSK